MTQKSLLGIIAVLILVLVFGYLGFLAGSRRGGPIGPYQPSITATPTVTSTPQATVTTTPTLTPTVTVSPTQTQSAKKTQVTVYQFSKALFDKVGSTVYWEPVIRETTRSDVATFAIEEIIKGPTPEEINQGLGQTFGTGKFVVFTDSSNCSGRDFSINVTNGTATVRFCRSTQLTGDSSGYIVTGEFVSTLKKFSTVKKVVVLNKAGQCFNNMSGKVNPADCTF